MTSEGKQTCPHCGQLILAGARKCRYCKAWIDEEENDDDEREGEYKRCPRCQARGAERVIFTFWGSFYGPALFSHVACPKCHYQYNGTTGRSNLIPAIIFVMVPLLLIVGIIGGVWLLVANLGGPGGR